MAAELTLESFCLMFQVSAFPPVFLIRPTDRPGGRSLRVSLSVACGDSSPKGRACASSITLPLWGRWQHEVLTERVLTDFGFGGIMWEKHKEE